MNQDLTPAQLADARVQLAKRVPKARIARNLGVDRSTLYRAFGRDDEPTASDPVAG